MTLVPPCANQAGAVQGTGKSCLSCGVRGFVRADYAFDAGEGNSDGLADRLPVREASGRSEG